MRSVMKVGVEIDLADRHADSILCAPIGSKTVRDYMVCDKEASKRDVVLAIVREVLSRAEIRAG